MINFLKNYISFFIIYDTRVYLQFQEQIDGGERSRRALIKATFMVNAENLIVPH